VSAIGCSKGDVNRNIPQDGDIAILGKPDQSAATHATDFSAPVYNVWKQQRRAGEVLAGMVKAGNPELLRDETIRLSDIGVTRAQSHRWQTVAAVEDGRTRDPGAGFSLRGAVVYASQLPLCFRAQEGQPHYPSTPLTKKIPL